MRPAKTRREKEIWEACDALYATFNEANKITGELIFNMLMDLGYKKGSPNEVYRYRKTWLEEKGFEISNSSSQVYNIEDPLTRVAKLVRDEIQSEFIAEKSRLIDEYEKQLNAITQAYEDTKSECISFINKNDVLESQLSELIHTHENLKIEYQQLSTENNRLNDKLSEEQQKYTDFKLHTESMIAAILQEQQQASIRFQDTLIEMKSAFEKDAGDYKTLLEKERHVNIVKIDNLQSMYHRLEKDLSLSHEKIFSIQAENAFLKDERLSFYQKMQEIILNINVQCQALKELPSTQSSVVQMLTGLPGMQSLIIQISANLTNVIDTIKAVNEKMEILTCETQLDEVCT